MAKLVVAAGRDDLAVGAWVGVAAVARADESRPAGLVSPFALGAEMQGLMAVRGELMENRRTLRNVGGNLNDVARVANSTERLAPQTAQVQAMVERAVSRVDECVARLDGIVRGLQGELLRRAR